MDKAKLLLVAGAGLGLGILALSGFKHIRLSRAVDDLIDGNPDLFGSGATTTQTRPPWAF